MRILILGGSGFIGMPLAHFLVEQGHEVSITSRRAVPAEEQSGVLRVYQWNGASAEDVLPYIQGSDVIINLVGKKISQGRWTARNKHAIEQSRVLSTEAVLDALHLLYTQGHRLPHTFLQASACGYYGSWKDSASAPLCAESQPAGKGFLASVCQRWEENVQGVSALGVRCCVLRFAPVLGKKFSEKKASSRGIRDIGTVGGFLAPLILPFKVYLGGVVGSGKQPFSWVHRDDVLGAVHHLLEQGHLKGVFNVCSPQWTTMGYFTKTLAKTLQRPAWLPLPAPLVRLVGGQMAEELILSGQRAVPQHLLHSGFQFAYPELPAALEACL